MALLFGLFLLMLVPAHGQVPALGHVDVVFVNAVPRFRVVPYFDYYFLCIANDFAIAWFINGEYVEGFDRNDKVGEVRSQTYPDASAVISTVILLSIRDIDIESASLTTILIVSARNNSRSLSVSCVSNTGRYDNFSINDIPSSVQTNIVQNDDRTASVEYLFDYNILTYLKTRFLLCNTTGENQNLYVNEQFIGRLNSFDDVGAYKTENSSDNTIASKEIVLLSKHQIGLQKSMTSLFILSEITNDANVTCSTGTSHAMLYPIIDSKDLSSGGSSSSSTTMTIEANGETIAGTGGVMVSIMLAVALPFLLMVVNIF